MIITKYQNIYQNYNHKMYIEMIHTYIEMIQCMIMITITLYYDRNMIIM